MVAVILLAFGVSMTPSANAGLFTTSKDSGYVALRDNNQSNPYPVVFNFSGVSGRVVDVTVELQGISHTYLPDLSILLVSWDGKASYVMGDVGGGNPGLNNQTLVFNDNYSSSMLPDQIPGTAGSPGYNYKPSKFYPTGDVDTFPGAPAGPYQKSFLDVFRGMPDANGDWKVYIIDDSVGDLGQINNIKLTLVTSTDANTAPVLSPIGNQKVDEDSGQSVVGVHVEDVDAPTMASVRTKVEQVKKSDGNPLDGENGNLLEYIRFSTAGDKQGMDREIQYKPNTDESGKATFKVTAEDGQGGVDTKTFVIEVRAVNDAPAITYTYLGVTYSGKNTTIPVTIKEPGTGHPTPNSFTFTANVSDNSKETPANKLLVVGNSSNKDVIPVDNAYINIVGEGPTFTVTVTPRDYRWGNDIIITMTVQDLPVGAATDPDQQPIVIPGPQFVVKVESVIDAPVWKSFPSASPIISNEDADITIPVIIEDHESLPENPNDVQVEMYSDNDNLISDRLYSASDNKTLRVGAGLTIVSITPDGLMSAILTWRPNQDANSVMFGNGNVNFKAINAKNPTVKSQDAIIQYQINPVADNLKIEFKDGDNWVATGPTKTLDEDTTTAGTVKFRINDPDKAPGSMPSIILNYSSSDPSKINTVNVAPLPPFDNRAELTGSFLPLANAFGSTIITLRASDNLDPAHNAQNTFTVNITSKNDAPSITAIPDQIVPESGADQTVQFFVYMQDVDNAGGDLQLSFEPRDPATNPDWITREVKWPDNFTIEPNPADSYSRLVKIKVPKKAWGSYLFKAVVKDASATTKTDFNLIIQGVNDPVVVTGLNPSSPFTTVTVEEGRNSVQPFTVADGNETKPEKITSTIINLVQPVPPASPTPVPVFPADMITVQVGVSGGNRTLLVTAKEGLPTGRPLAPNEELPFTFQVQIADEGYPTPANTQTITVNGILKGRNEAPVIKDINPSSVVMNEDTISFVNFVAWDRETPNNLTMIGPKVSGDTAMLPQSNVYYTGVDTNKTLIIQPVANKFGTAVVTIQVQDPQGLKSAEHQISVTVNSVNDYPVVSDIPDQVDVSPMVRDYTNEMLEYPGKEDGRKIVFTATDPDNGTLPDVFVGDGTYIKIVSQTTDQADDDNKLFAADKDHLKVEPLPYDKDTNPNRHKWQITLRPNEFKTGSAQLQLIVKNNNHGLETVKTFNVQVMDWNTKPVFKDLQVAWTFNEDDDAKSDVFEIWDEETATLNFINWDGSGSEPTGAYIRILESSNPTLIPATTPYVKLETPDAGDSGKNPGNKFRKISVRPAFGRSGTAVLKIKAKDDGAGSTGSTDRMERIVELAITVNEVNDPPYITINNPIPNPNQAAKPGMQRLLFTVDDPETVDYNKLIITAKSLNPLVIPNDPVTGLLQTYGSSPSNPQREVWFWPAASAFGKAEIEITVTDNGPGTPLSDTKKQTITVNRINEAPYWVEQHPADKPVELKFDEDTTKTYDQLTPVDSEVNVAPFFNPYASPFEQMTFVFESSNQQLFPLDNPNYGIFYTIIQNPNMSGPGSPSKSLRLTFIPAPNFNGSAVIKAYVKDGGVPAVPGMEKDYPALGPAQSVAFQFNITVNAVNDAPSISTINPSPLSMGQNSQAPVTFSVSDAWNETAADLLQVIATSSDESIIKTSDLTIARNGSDMLMLVKSQSKNGQVDINIKCTDPQGLFTTRILVVKVGEGDFPPILTGQFGPWDTKPQTFTYRNFQVSDEDPNTVKVEVKSSNETVAKVFLVSQTQLLLQSFSEGTAQITVTATDKFGQKDTEIILVKVEGTEPQVATDINGDGKTDALLQRNDGTVAVWFMDDYNFIGGELFSPSNPGAGWKLITSADFNGDSQFDLLWQHSDGSLALWQMNGTQLAPNGAMFLPYPGTWKAVGAADLSQDGQTDIILQDVDGTVGVWLMNGTTLLQPQIVAAPGDPNFKVVGVGDLNGDQQADIVFQNSSTSVMAVWFMNRYTLATGEILTPQAPADPNYQAVAVGDYDGDGKADIVFQYSDPLNPAIAVWHMNGSIVNDGKFWTTVPAESGWSVVGP